MWLKFPPGTERISIQQQHFSVEVKDDMGQCYGRIPNHFAPQLIQQLGFHVSEPPPGAPDDFAPADPLRDGAIADLSRENDVLRQDTGNLRSDIVALRAALGAMTNERDELKRKLDTAEARVAELEEEKDE